MPFLLILKMSLKKKMQELETLVAEKEDRIKEIYTELERTQKNLKMLNSGSAQLDHILSRGKNIEISRDWASKMSILTQKPCFLRLVLFLVMLYLFQKKESLLPVLSQQQTKENLLGQNRNLECVW